MPSYEYFLPIPHWGCLLSSRLNLNLGFNTRLNLNLDKEKMDKYNNVIENLRHNNLGKWNNKDHDNHDKWEGFYTKGYLMHL